jgi:hypothetical protein
MQPMQLSSYIVKVLHNLPTSKVIASRTRNMIVVMFKRVVNTKKYNEVRSDDSYS